MTTTAQLIREIVGSHSGELVERYFDPTSRFAGSTFDALPPLEPDRITTGDLLAVGLLDVPLTPPAVRALLGQVGRRVEEHLVRIPSDVDLWEASEDQLEPAYAMWRLLRDGLRGTGVGSTRCSKLMARKRPRLIPVVDSTIRTRLGIGPRDDSWLVFRDALRADPALVELIDGLRPPTAPTSVVSTLRILDAALWMNLSNSTHVTRLAAEARGRAEP